MGRGLWTRKGYREIGMNDRVHGSHELGAGVGGMGVHFEHDTSVFIRCFDGRRIVYWS